VFGSGLVELVLISCDMAPPCGGVFDFVCWGGVRGKIVIGMAAVVRFVVLYWNDVFSKTISPKPFAGRKD